MMENNRYKDWRKNIKMMWNSPSRVGEKMNDGLLETWKKGMIEFAAQLSIWEKNMKNSAAEIVNTLKQENDLMLVKEAIYMNDNHKAGEY